MRLAILSASCAAAACAAVACAQPAPAPPAPPATDVRVGSSIEISGLLSRKGPAETSWWAVTDPSGKVWQIVHVGPALDARLQSLQNRQVTLRVESRGRALFEQVQVLDVVRPVP